MNANPCGSGSTALYKTWHYSDCLKHNETKPTFLLLGWGEGEEDLECRLGVREDDEDELLRNRARRLSARGGGEWVSSGLEQLVVAAFLTLAAGLSSPDITDWALTQQDVSSLRTDWCEWDWDWLPVQYTCSTVPVPYRFREKRLHKMSEITRNFCKRNFRTK